MLRRKKRNVCQLQGSLVANIAGSMYHHLWTNCDEHIHIVTAKPSQKAAASLLQELAGPGVTEQAS